MSVYGSPAAWARGPDLVYGALARAAVARLPGPLAGRLAVDAGTGTGAVARALAARGACVVALDSSAAMVGYASTRRAPGVVADIRAVPVRTSTVDIAVAGFVLSHLPDPVVGLVELARVTRAGGWVLATAFPTDRTGHPIKDAVDRVLDAFGYAAPDWYLALKGEGEERVGTAAGLLDVGREAGLAGGTVAELTVGLDLTAGELARWRLGMGHVAPWLSTVDPARRSAVVTAATTAVAATALAPLPMLVLLAHPTPASPVRPA